MFNMFVVDATITSVTPGVGQKNTAHAADDTAPGMGAYLPAGQGVHSEAPAAAEYVPAEQGVGFTEERGQNEPAGQSTGEPEAQ
jgi:hypothetical protein